LHQSDVAVDGHTYRIASFTQTTDIVTIQVDEKQRFHQVVNLIVAYAEL